MSPLGVTLHEACPPDDDGAAIVHRMMKCTAGSDKSVEFGDGDAHVVLDCPQQPVRRDRPVHIQGATVVGPVDIGRERGRQDLRTAVNDDTDMRDQRVRENSCNRSRSVTDRSLPRRTVVRGWGTVVRSPDHRPRPTARPHPIFCRSDSASAVRWIRTLLAVVCVGHAGRVSGPRW